MTTRDYHCLPVIPNGKKVRGYRLHHDRPYSDILFPSSILHHSLLVQNVWIVPPVLLSCLIHCFVVSIPLFSRIQLFLPSLFNRIQLFVQCIPIDKTLQLSFMVFFFIVPYIYIEYYFFVVFLQYNTIQYNTIIFHVPSPDGPSRVNHPSKNILSPQPPWDIKSTSQCPVLIESP